MKHQQSGFTLVEIAIVLVIVGLLLGGVLKGQELINSAKVKNIISDMNGISVMVIGYQDKYRGTAGDQNQSQLNNNFGLTPVNGAPATEAAPTTGLNNGRLDGNWNSGVANTAAATETELFWQHVRLANLASGATTINDPNYYPRNSDGGLIGIESGLTSAGVAAPFIAGMTGSYYICTDNVQGRYAKQIDTTVDDGNSAAGSVRIVATGAVRGATAVVTTSIVDGSLYIVCRSF